MARRRYKQSRQNAILQWLIPTFVLIMVVLVQTQVGREVGWIGLLVMLGFMVWFSVLYEKSREEEPPDDAPPPESP